MRITLFENICSEFQIAFYPSSQGIQFLLFLFFSFFIPAMACIVSTSRCFNGATTTTTTTIMIRDTFITTTAVAVVDVATAVAAAVAESSVDLSAAHGTRTGTGTGSRWSAYSTVEDQSQE